MAQSEPSHTNGNNGSDSNTNVDNVGIINPNGGNDGNATNPNSVRTLTHQEILQLYSRFPDYCVQCMDCHSIFSGMCEFIRHYPRDHDYNLLVNSICRINNNPETAVECLLCGTLSDTFQNFCRHAINTHIMYNFNRRGFECMRCNKCDHDVFEILIHLGYHAMEDD